MRKWVLTAFVVFLFTLMSVMPVSGYWGREETLESAWSMNKVTVDGKVTSPEEWADANTYEIPLYNESGV
ncbi:MAG: hypothetical protein QXE22_07460 [Candidatus Bathyarchaeia archaeon]